MKVRDHRLRNDDGTTVPLINTPNKRGSLKGGKPKYVVIHFTAGGSAQGAINWFKNPDAKASAHLVIGHDGAITQMGKFNERLWHAGKSKWNGHSGLNSHSVGIEIANWGGLKGDWGGWRSWTGKLVPDDRVIEAAHRNSPGHVQGWEIYDEEQIDATAATVRALADEYGLAAADVIGHDDISPIRKTDPGPAWDMDRFRARIFGRSDDGDETQEVFKVAANSGLNMRKGPGVDNDVVKLLASGANVALVERSGLWWMVAELVGGKEDSTGWVHSRWLTAA